VTTIPYRIRRSERARRARILVDGDGVEVVVPRRFPLREVEPFVEEKRAWIERTLRRLRETEAQLPVPRLEEGGWVPYLGESLSLAVRVEAGRQREHVARRGDVLRVALPTDPGRLPPPGGQLALPGADAPSAGGRHAPASRDRGALAPAEDVLRAALERWYRRRARAEVAPRLDAACARAGTTYARLQIRGQRTRWASCSSTGAMSFNWRLLLAPAEILDYVVEHEVAHLELLDHSPRFWRLLASRCPEWREREAWLRRHGHALKL
jgi:predicted metal-dependent hydrolase